ncbi:hybrid sensor histidine kinase/response regulator [Flavitalea antarctica]
MRKRSSPLKKLLFIGAILTSASVGRAQTSELNFINFSNKAGLSSNSINDIIKDRQGYMWFGTETGLNKFDGLNFTVYGTRSGDSTSIGGNEIIALAEDKKGNLWVGTDQSLSYYDRKNDAFINYDFVKNSSARALAVDSSGDLWVGSYYGLYRFKPGKGVIRHYTSKPSGHSQLQSNKIISLFVDSRNQLWIGTPSGLHRYDRSREGFVIYQHSTTDSNSIADNLVRSITEDKSGNLYFATNKGVSQLMAGTNKFKTYRAGKDPHTLSSELIYKVAYDKSGSLWVGTENGLNILDPVSGKVTRILHEPRNKYSLSGKSIRAIFIDDNGLYWVGGYHSGVNKYDKNLAFFNLTKSNPFDASGLSAPLVTSFVERSKDEIYVGTDGGGLNLYNRKTKLCSHPQLDQEGKGKAILDMEQDGDDLWVGTFRDGVYVLNMKSGKVTNHFKGGPKDLSGPDIFCVKKDSKGLIWIGTNGHGITVYDPRTQQFTKVSDTIDGDKQLGNAYIRVIEEDKEGNMWIGTQGTGVIFYDRVARSYKIFDQDNSKLPSNKVLSIHSDRDNEIWVSTPGGGVVQFDKQSQSFRNVPKLQALANTVIYKILEDNSGKFWASTNAGIVNFCKDNSRFKTYAAQNGVQQSDFYRGSGMMASNGWIFFGGLDGFNFFEPASLVTNRNVPELVFRDLRISNRSVVPGKKSAISQHISIAEEIHLDHKQNFSLDFTTLNYTSPFENRYSYKLEGFEKDWNDIGSRQTAVYTNLDPGDYTFKVKARSDDGLWESKEKTIRIFVKPPIWRTVYAYIFYVLSAFLILALIRYRGIRKLKNKFKLEQERLQFSQMLEQEKRERERQHDFDQQKIKFLTNLSHEFRTPISLILAPADKLAGIEEDDEKLEQIGVVRRNARRLLNLVNQLLDFRKLEERELNLFLSDGDLIACIHDVADSFRDIWDAKHIEFTYKSDLQQYITRFDRDKMERILLNLMSNAVKFTPDEGKISLEVEQDTDQSVLIRVRDTGIGMSPEESSKVFDRFFQAKTKEDVLSQGSGIGLSITREFVRLHGGTIKVESEPGKGSVFTMLFPFKPLQVVSGNAAPGLTCPSQDLLSKTRNCGRSISETAGPEKLPVLIVEDNEEFRNYLKNNLSAGYKIIEASNGKEGWQKALASHPKIIVSDVNMPGMDGITLCRKLQSDKRTKHIPIILLTALNGDENQLEGLETGASDYLTKPFNFDILHIKIKNLLALNKNLETTYSKQLKIEVPEVSVQSHDEQLLLKITRFIENNIDNPNLSVEELSKHVFMSRRSLYSKIMELTGETPVEFIRSLKLQKAVALLENSDMKMSEIAYTTGFATANYFTRAFKAKYNVSPTEYVTLKKGQVVRK